MAFLDCSCGKKLKVADDAAGKRFRCPGCGHVLTLPPGIAEQATAVSPPTGRAAAPGASSRAESEGGDFTKYLSPAKEPDELGRLGGYRILKVLGQGGMGVVYQAEDIKLKRKVALKAMLPSKESDPVVTKRFLREAESMAALEHPHIVRLYQVGEERDIPFLAMELLKGQSLAERLDSGADFSVAEVLRIGREIALGLGAAHEQGLIHRDIKPANIWLEPSGFVKLLDFGLARRGDTSQLTVTGMVLGTPGYIAPEQARGEKIDGRTDLFSLGAVLNRMTTGRLPFEGKNLVSVLMAMAKHDPQPPQLLNFDIPSEVSDLIMKLLAKSPADRCQSAGEVVERIAAIETEQADPGVSPRIPIASPRRTAAAYASGPLVSRPRGRGSRLWLWAGLAATAAVALASGLVWYANQP
jgi:serine/threonine protein kinase